MTINPRHNIREIRSPRGTELSAKSWMTEAPLRMLMNNLDPDVAENPHELVVYGGIGRAARTSRMLWRGLMVMASLPDQRASVEAVASRRSRRVFR